MAIQSIHDGFFATIRGACFLFSTVDGCNKVGEVAVSIFSHLEDTNLSSRFSILSNRLYSVMNVTCFFSMIHLLDSIINPDEHGKYPWHYSWQSIASAICDAVATILNCVWYLDSLNIYPIGKSIHTINYVYSWFMMGGYGFDLWENFNIVTVVKQKYLQAIAVGNVFLQQKEYCKLVKKCLYIAVEVANIALYVISFVFPAPKAALSATIGICTILTNTGDLVHFLLDNYTHRE